MNLTIEEGNKVRLPDEFVKFWNLSVGDEVPRFPNVVANAIFVP